MNYNNFRAKVLKVNKKKKFKVRNSYGTKQGWRWYKKNKWLGSEPVTEKQFGCIIRVINEALVEQLLQGADINLPCRMGRIELRKVERRLEFKDGQIDTNLPVDWDRTLKLWYEDAASYESKTLIRKEYKEIFRIIYNKSNANYNNKTFYQFVPHREVKKKLSERIKQNETDAFLRYAVH